MPPYEMVTSTFLKQVFSGKKKLIKMKHLRSCNPPRYDEISVKSLYEYCLSLYNMKYYFPDEYPQGRTCNR